MLQLKIRVIEIDMQLFPLKVETAWLFQPYFVYLVALC